MENKKRIFSRLYWKISAIFILVLVLFAAITIYTSIQSANQYSIEVTQKLNWNLARNMVDVMKPEFRDGMVNKDAVADIMHSMMVINPSVEVYLLNPEGKILSYVAPAKVVKLTKVSLAPVYRFLNDTRQNLILGDDPRNPGEKKTFSAAKVIDNERSYRLHLYRTGKPGICLCGTDGDRKLYPGTFHPVDDFHFNRISLCRFAVNMVHHPKTEYHHCGYP